MKFIQSLASPLTFPTPLSRFLEMRVRGLARALLQRERLVAASSPETVQTLQLTADSGFVSANFRPQIGFGLCRPFTGDAGMATLHLLAGMASLGLTGSWRVQSDEGMGLFLGGHVLEVQGDVELVSSSDAIEVRSGHTALHLARATLGECCGPVCHGIGVGSFVDSLIEGRALGQFDHEKSSRLVHDALALLAEVGAPWRSSVDWVYRALIFVDCPEGTTSGSTPTWLGASFFGGDLSREQLALLMVHECAHQCLNLVCSCVDLVDPGHQQLYYSTLKRQPRPLLRVLYALHACAWMLQYLDDAAAKGLNGPWWRLSRAEMAEGVQVMSDSIGASPGLTKEGVRLVAELRRAVQAPREVTVLGGAA